jgi:hypothetical protein
MHVKDGAAAAATLPPFFRSFTSADWEGHASQPYKLNIMKYKRRSTYIYNIYIYTMRKSNQIKSNQKDNITEHRVQ